MEFNNKTHCWKCKRFIDGVIVCWKKIVIGEDNTQKWEVYCADCVSGKRIQKEEGEKE